MTYIPPSRYLTLTYLALRKLRAAQSALTRLLKDAHVRSSQFSQTGVVYDLEEQRRYKQGKNMIAYFS